jgi:PPM family protein phosphatase
MGWKKLFGVKTQPTAAGAAASVEPSDLKVVVVTDLGNIRTNNEDTGIFFRVADPNVLRQKGVLMLVADGMGGHAAGEVASRMAADTITSEYFNNGNNTGIEKKLGQVFTLANKNIYAAAASSAACKGMGTTCTALAVINDQVYYAHVGDSRAYVIKDDAIAQITTDHTYVQELITEGKITPEEAGDHPQRNILTNAMGTKPNIRIDTGKCNFTITENDKLLLCSDGLYEYLEDTEIAGILKNLSAQEAAETLVATAKARGGHDNITVVLAVKTSISTGCASKETRDFILPVTKEIDLP